MVYAAVSKDCAKVMLCTAQVILKYGKMEVPNKLMANNEYFYEVPIEEWRIYNIEEGKHGKS
jgi:hypothetical protein